MQMQKGERMYHYLPCKLPSEVEERLLKVVVALCRYLIVLQILLPVESNLLGFNLHVLHINLVSAENNGNVLTDTEITIYRTKYTKSSSTKGKIKLKKDKLGMKPISLFYSPAEITVPCRNILVCQPSRDIKHNDCTLPMNTA